MPLTVSRLILHGADHLHMVPPPPRRRPPRLPSLAIRKINIRDGRGFGLAEAIQEMERRGFDVMLLMETNIQLEAYSHKQLNYVVTCLSAIPSRSGGSQCSVVMVTTEWHNRWGIKLTRFHRPNVVSCKIVTRHIWTPLVGAYLPPLTLEHLQ